MYLKWDEFFLFTLLFEELGRNKTNYFLSDWLHLSTTQKNSFSSHYFSSIEDYQSDP